MEEALSWKNNPLVLLFPLLDSSEKLTSFTCIGGLLCHLCTQFHLFLDLVFVENHFYPEVIPMEKVKSYFKVTYEILFHILNVTHWKYHIFILFCYPTHALYYLRTRGSFCFCFLINLSQIHLYIGTEHFPFAERQLW